MSINDKPCPRVRIAHHVNRFPIVYLGSAVLLALGLTAVFLRKHFYDGLALPSDLGPEPPHIGVMRLIGVLVAVCVLLWAQRLYSKLQRTQEKLSHAEQLYRKVLDTSPDPITLLDAEGRIVMANRQAAMELGYGDVSEIVGKSALSFVWPLDREMARGNIGAIMNGRRGEKTEYKMIKANGDPLPVEISSCRLTDVDGLPTALLSVFREVSGRRQIEKRILDACEEERRRIGLDLHDAVCSELTGIAFMADGSKRAFRNECEPAAEQFGEISALIKDAASNARALAQGLCTIAVGPGKLKSALAEMISQSERRAAIRCRFVCEETLDVMEESAATHLYRIAQEAVYNALRHARPALVRVVLAEEGTSLRLRIEDDGIGMPEDSRKLSGMGLDIMRYRSRMIDGRFEIFSRAGGGTVVQCTVPEKVWKGNEDERR